MILKVVKVISRVIRATLTLDCLYSEQIQEGSKYTLYKPADRQDFTSSLR